LSVLFQFSFGLLLDVNKKIDCNEYSSR